MNRILARLNVQEIMQALREANAAASNGWRQLTAACSLKRAAIVVQKHPMSRSLKGGIATARSARRSKIQAGFQATWKRAREGRLPGSFITRLLKLH
jgi:hypothetical protein